MWSRGGLWALVVAGLVALPCSARGGRRRGRLRPFRQVRCTQGAARGYFAPRPPHYAFLGLPYARAPTPHNRFKAPEPPPSWDGIFEATHRIQCTQNGAGQENCLVVNVFVPQNGTELPVLVFVHDGHFQAGQGAFQPPARLLSEGLIVVTFNYRLGLLGFLCLGTPNAPGNAGLKDQVAALYWVQRNIASFGGKPTDITVYGIGSGAIATHLLLLTGLTEGLIHKVVLESGSALSPLSLNYEPVALAMSTAATLGYDGEEDVIELAEFFQRVPAHKLINITEMYLPCIEKHYYDLSLLDWDPIEIMKKGSYQQVPIITMYSSQDGLSIVMNNVEKFEGLPIYFDELLPSNLMFNDGKIKIQIGQFVKEFYFDNINNNIEQNYADYFLDVLYEYPIIKTGILYGEQSSSPFYVLKFAYKRKGKELVEGSDYEMISNYVFAPEGLDEDECVAAKLITLLCNFIKVGDPTPIKTSTLPIIWVPIQENFDEKINIQSAPLLLLDDRLTMSSTAASQRLIFWDRVYENFYRTQAPKHEDYVDFK